MSFSDLEKQVGEDVFSWENPKERYSEFKKEFIELRKKTLCANDMTFLGVVAAQHKLEKEAYSCYISALSMTLAVFLPENIQLVKRINKLDNISPEKKLIWIDTVIKIIRENKRFSDCLDLGLLLIERCKYTLRLIHPSNIDADLLLARECFDECGKERYLALCGYYMVLSVNKKSRGNRTLNLKNLWSKEIQEFVSHEDYLNAIIYQLYLQNEYFVAYKMSKTLESITTDVRFTSDFFMSQFDHNQTYQYLMDVISKITYEYKHIVKVNGVDVYVPNYLFECSLLLNDIRKIDAVLEISNFINRIFGLLNNDFMYRMYESCRQFNEDCVDEWCEGMDDLLFQKDIYVFLKTQNITLEEYVELLNLLDFLNIEYLSVWVERAYYIAQKKFFEKNVAYCNAKVKFLNNAINIRSESFYYEIGIILNTMKK